MWELFSRMAMHNCKVGFVPDNVDSSPRRQPALQVPQIQIAVLELEVDLARTFS